MKSLGEIEITLKSHKKELAEKYLIQEIGIFGSYIRSEQKEGSDLDLLVEFKENADIDLLQFVNMENYLSDLLGLKVDLVEKCSLKTRIGKHIVEEVMYL